jgi:hypothetical protein
MDLRPSKEVKMTQDLPSWRVDTLDVLRKSCAAKLVREDRSAKTLDVPASNQGYVVHLVYRKPPENPPVQVSLTDGKRRETFVLDLPAPLGRSQDLAWPGQGRPLRVELSAPASVTIDEFQVWGFKWPSKNLAYVRPAGGEGGAGAMQLGDEDKGDEEDAEGDDLTGEDEGSSQGLYGKMKDAFIRVRNPDPDQVAGPYLSAGDNPLKVLNGVLYSADRTNDWSDKPNSRGVWFEVSFGKDATFGLVAFYSHTNRQSELARCYGVMTYEVPRAGTAEMHHDRPLGLVMDNDQFFRLMAVPKSRGRILRVYLGQVRRLYGLSEVEVYSVPASGPR